MISKINTTRNSRVKDLSGKKIWNLYVDSFAYTETRNKECSAVWNCICSCGNKRLVNSTSLRKGDIKSCHDCTAKKHIIHGMHTERFYRIWIAIRCRCRKDNGYVKNGIKTSSYWESFETFKKRIYIINISNILKKYGEKKIIRQ